MRKNKPFWAAHRSGITLIEVITSLSIMSVLMLGLSSAIMISSYAIPSPTESGMMDQLAVDRLNQFRMDLRESSTVKLNISGSDYTLALRIKDSGIAGSPSNIYYSYDSGTQLFRRKVDAEDSVDYISGVDAFIMTITIDGTHVRRLNLMIAIQDTLQRFYELHVALPDKPENA